MPFVRFIRNTFAGGKPAFIGKVAELSDKEAAIIVAIGKAVLVEKPAASTVVDAADQHQHDPGQRRLPKRGRPPKK